LIVFTGQMDYAPNADAVARFAEEALPLIGGATFAIVGRNPTRAVRRLARRERVIVTGEVADVRTWLAAADIVVATLRIARGVQNKVLEAMAMARPVVASPAAFEGIEAEPGRDLIVAVSPEAQARAIEELLASPAQSESLGRAARISSRSALPGPRPCSSFIGTRRISPSSGCAARPSTIVFSSRR
jgi:glycosyltransferase involved in cell wall biosynthesis